MRAALLPLAALAALAPCVRSQGSNVTLLDTLDPRNTYNDVWGYVAPNGNEYAILCSTDGTTIVNCVDPRNIYQTGFISGANSTWRDARTYGTYAYVVTEGAGGVQVIDLSNPESPSLAGTFGTTRFGNAHNVCIDLGTGMLYAVGTNNGNVAFDLTTSPTNPAYVGSFGAGNSGYNHDLCVENGYFYGSMIYNGYLRIADTSTFPPTTLSNTSTPNTFTHNAWPNAAGTVVCTTDERSGGVVAFYDITNKSSPQFLSQYTPNTAAIPHNAFIVGDVMHVSFYTEGYRAVDISDPTNPTEIGYYDTWPGGSGGFNGAWGVYPFQPSGNIYISDISTGLYVVTLNQLSVQSTPLGDTTDEIGPYDVTATVVSGTALSGVDLFWSTDGGSNYTQVAMTPTGNPDEYGASIPGQDAPTTVTYYVEATNQGGTNQSSTSSFFVGSRVVVYSEDFEANDGGYTHGTFGPQDDWQWGVPQGKSGDPSAAGGGNNCWGNDLGPQGWNGAYQNNTNNYLDSPTIPTNGAQGIQLRFKRWLTVESGQYDQATLYVNNQQIWQNPATGDLTDTSWQTVSYDISSITNGASSVQIRWQMQADGGVAFGGWNIDDVELIVESDCVPGIHYGTGTAGTGGVVPTIGQQNFAALGSSNFAITGANMVGGGFAFLALAPLPGMANALGTTVLLDPATQVDVFLVPVSGVAGQAGAGTASQSFPVPNSAALDNLYFYFQWLPIDSGNGLTFSASDGLQIRVCQG